MKKKWLLAAILAGAMMVAGCGAQQAQAPAEEPAQQEETQEQAAGMANPWVDLASAEEAQQASGMNIGVPEGAENVLYRWNGGEQMLEVQFTWGDMDYTARMMPAAEFTDISGVYCNWDSEDPFKVKYVEDGIERRGQEGGTYIDCALWYDVVPGFMYSLVATSPNELDGFDITAAADQVFLPMQGEA